MIKLINRGLYDSTIEFRPISKKTIGFDRRLIYGHECEWCGNTVQALFLTEDPVNLDLYEQTRVISQGDKNEGQLLKIVPNTEDTVSAYKTDFYHTKQGSAQLIRLKNHVINWAGLAGNRDNFFEVGERCCKYSGIIATLNFTIVSELATICGYQFDSSYVTKPKSPVPLSFLATWKPMNTWGKLDFKILEAIGKGPDLVLLHRDVLRGMVGATSSFQDIFDQWNKDKPLYV